MNLNLELQVAVDLARAAGAVLLEHYYGPFLVEQKVNALDELEEVTAADREANELIVSRLQEEFPDDGILAEESTDSEHRLEKDRVWLIDPMDGTKNFIARDGDFAVQIGLAVGGESILGVVYQPTRKALYRAVRGGGAWIEDEAGRRVGSRTRGVRAQGIAKRFPVQRRTSPPLGTSISLNASRPRCWV